MINRIYHGKRNTSLYEIWCSMKQRCDNINNKNYKNYGGRGIIMCDEWKNDFQKFYDWSISNGYVEEKLESGLNKFTIDRIDNNGNYEPTNCRWVTAKEQALNKRNVLYYEYNNNIYTLEELSSIYKIEKMTLYYRLEKLKWSIDDAVSRKSENMPYKTGATGHRNVYKVKNGYKVIVSHKYIGTSNTLNGAIKIRDNFIKELEK